MPDQQSSPYWQRQQQSPVPNYYDGSALSAAPGLLLPSGLDLSGDDALTYGRLDYMDPAGYGRHGPLFLRKIDG